MPYFSIVVPVFNVEKYINECLDSLLSQSFSDFEVILIDDGSSDQSLKLISKYGLSDSRFKVFTQENKGLSDTRNLGVSYAQGKYLIFLDSDDLLSKDALKTIHSHCQNKHLDMLMFGAKAFYDNKASAPDDMYYRSDGLLNTVKSGPEYFAGAIINKMFHPSACLYAVRLDIAREISFLSGIYHEDNLYTVQLLFSNRCNKTFVIKDKLYLRRVRESSITTSEVSMKHSDGYLAVYKELIAKPNRLRVETPTIKHSIDIYIKNILASAIKKAYEANHKNIPFKNRLKYVWYFLSYQKNIFDKKLWILVLSPKAFYLLKNLLVFKS